MKPRYAKLQIDTPYFRLLVFMRDYELTENDYKFSNPKRKSANKRLE